MSVIGYKAAEHSGRRVLITLLIPQDALTNMNRFSIAVKETAKYRANKAIVLKIEDEKGTQYLTATSLFSAKPIHYERGSLIEEPSFNTDLERVTGEGIHFFLNRRVAELYRIPQMEDGSIESWYANGQKYLELAPEKEYYQAWYETGQKTFELTFPNNSSEGVYREWHINGNKKLEVQCKKYVMDGLSTGWYENGQKAFEVPYVNGKRQGIYRCWHENGSKHYEVPYVNGQEDGQHRLYTGWMSPPILTNFKGGLLV